MEKNFVIKNGALKGIALFSPEVSPEDSSGSEGSVSLTIKDNKLTFKISSFRYVLVGEESIEINDNVDLILPLKKLQDIVKNFDNEQELKFKIKDSDIEIKISGIKYKLKALEMNDGQIIQEERGEEYLVKTSKFLEGFKKLKIAMGDDEVRYYLNGIHTEILQNKNNENDLFFVATSGHLMGTFGHKQEGFEIKEKAIVPKKVVSEVIKVLESASEEVKVSIKNNKMSVKTEKLEILVKLIEAEFPDYNRVIPNENSKTITFETDIFKTTLSKILIISATDKSKEVTLLSKDKVLNLEVVSENGQTADAEIPLTNDFDELNTKLNSKYILDILAQIVGDGNTKIRFFDGNSPLIIEKENDKNLLYVVMPIRV
ncbi:MAG: DNA polymerase III subunit beta [Rickettsiales bacterium]|jgi:DNA polymerase-3 subunit beta|nr:DNA polymerase III subunit beta [Rickettsiales bacterium]